MERFFSKTTTWHLHQLPYLHTAVNSQRILAEKRLCVSFALTQGTSTAPDNFAYAVIELDTQWLRYQGSEVQKDIEKAREKIG